MHRLIRPATKATLTLTLALTAFFTPRDVRAALIRPDASQSFPDLSGDIVGTQNYDFDPVTGVGTFSVNNTPTLLAVGPQASSEYFVTDSADTIRGQSLSLKLDSSGQLLNDPSNSFKLSGTVVVDGQTFTGVLLEGTPTRFGWADQNPSAPTMSVYDVDMTLTGGKLKEVYGPDAYLRIITETNSNFDGTFSRNFRGSKALTNLRAYNAPTPNPIPEPSGFFVLLACGAAGLLFRHRKSISGPDLFRPRD